MDDNSKTINFSIVIGFITLIFVQSSWAGLRVMPTYVFLDDNSRSFKISLKHQGKKSVTYKIKTVFYRQDSSGKMEIIKSAKLNERSAEKLIRFSPKRVKLEPGAEQVVRVVARRKKDLPAGDYRAHLRFVEESVLDEENSSEGIASMNMELKGRAAISIPIFIRHSSVDLNISFKKPVIFNDPKQGQMFKIEMSMAGNGFAFGNLKGYFKPKGSDSEKLVFFLRGISTYVPQRTITYAFNQTKDSIKNGILRFEYFDSKLRTGKRLAVIETKLK